MRSTTEWLDADKVLEAAGLDPETASLLGVTLRGDPDEGTAEVGLRVMHDE